MIAGGEIRFIPEVTPLQLDTHFTEGDMIRSALEITLSIWFLIQIVLTIKNIAQLSKKYDLLEYHQS